MDHSIPPSYFSMYDMEIRQTTLYMILESFTDTHSVLVTTIDEDKTAHKVYAIKFCRRTYDRESFDALEKSPIYGLDYHADIRRAYRRLGITVPREEVVDVLYLRASELAKQLDKVGEDSIGIFQNALAHGLKYTGATYEYELKALREVLAKFGNKPVDNETDNDV